jgi:hypothetical protein
MRPPTPPAMPGVPVLGNLRKFNRDRYGFVLRGYDTLGPLLACVWGQTARRCCSGRNTIRCSSRRPTTPS